MTDYEITGTTVREEHQVRVRLLLTGGDAVQTPETWRGGTFSFSPTSLQMVWVWGDGAWELQGCFLQGLRLNKDGSVNQRQIHDQKHWTQQSKGVPSMREDTPQQILDLVAEHRPTSVVIP